MCRLIKGYKLRLKYNLGQPEKICDDESATVFAVQLEQKQTIIVAGLFLFSHYDVELLQNIINVGIDLIMKTAEYSTSFGKEMLSERAIQLRTQYCELCAQYASTYMGLMEKELQLNINK